MEAIEVNKLLAARRELFLQENQKEWFDRGQVFKQIREDNGLPLNMVAKRLGISPGRLKRFENGVPVESAKLIESAYTLFLELRDLRFVIKDFVREVGEY